MPKAKPFGKEMILAAMAKTKSNKAAARYLNCSYIHYKMWAKRYDATVPGYANLFEQHKNQSLDFAKRPLEKLAIEELNNVYQKYYNWFKDNMDKINIEYFERYAKKFIN